MMYVSETGSDEGCLRPQRERVEEYVVTMVKKENKEGQKGFGKIEMILDKNTNSNAIIFSRCLKLTCRKTSALQHYIHLTFM